MLPGMANPSESKEEELRRLCLGYTEKIIHLRLDVVALQNCLIGKGLISKSDLDGEVEKIRLEAKTALNTLAGASPDKLN
jgi:hypothetical protein